MNANSRRRLAAAQQAVQLYLAEMSGSRKPPTRKAMLVVLLVLLWRKQRPIWTRDWLARAAGYKGTDGVDKALQGLLQTEQFKMRVVTLPGRSRNGPTIRREYYLDPAPALASMVVSRVAWQV